MATPCDDIPTLLANAKCIECGIPRGAQLPVLIYLFCAISDAINSIGPCIETTAVISGSDIDWTVAPLRFKVIVANVAFTFSNATAPAAEGKTVSVWVTSNGVNTITWPAGIKWPAAVVPTLTPTLNRTDIYTFTMVNGTIWGSYVQNLG